MRRLIKPKDLALFAIISELSNKQIGNIKELDIVMPMYNLLECSKNYSKTLGSLWQYHKDVLHIKGNRDISNS